MFVRMVNSCLIINMKQISLFYAENVLKMRKMRKSANYADPHHRILSDALVLVYVHEILEEIGILVEHVADDLI